MASMTSVISLVVLVLAAYCNAIPIEDHDHSGTFPTPRKHEFTSGKTPMDSRERMDVHRRFEEESTDKPNTHSERRFDEDLTTSRSESREDFVHPTSEPDVSRHSRFNDESSGTTVQSDHHFGTREDEDVTSMPDPETDDSQSERELEEKRFEDSTYDSKVDENEKKNDFMRFTTPFSSSFEHESFTSEPSTLVDSFGKVSHFLRNENKEQRRSESGSSEMDYEHTTVYTNDDKSSEDITHNFGIVLRGEHEKTSSETTETKYPMDDSSVPTKTHAGEKHPDTKTKKSDN